MSGDNWLTIEFLLIYFALLLKKREENNTPVSNVCNSMPLSFFIEILI